MNLDVEPIRIRLRWIDKQIKAVESECAAFAPKLNDYRTRVEPNEDSTEHIERVYLDWVVPEWWGVVVGEIMHNLRAALDNIVWQLVLANGHQPGDQHEFPIATDQDWYEKRAVRKLLNVPEPALAVIERVQPYKGPTNWLRVHPLWIIHNMNRIDKHHLLHVVAAYPQGMEFQVTEEMGAVKGHIRLSYRPLENGTEVRAFVSDLPFRGKVPVSDKATLHVIVMETEETPFYPFPGVLRTTEDAVSKTIEAIVTALAT
jgi:hypothetical protein